MAAAICQALSSFYLECEEKSLFTLVSNEPYKNT